LEETMVLKALCCALAVSFAAGILASRLRRRR
jgi:hypothetical protein